MSEKYKNSQKSIPKSQVFRCIYNLSGDHNTELLCVIAGVSPSGYYKHRKLVISNTTKEEREQEDVERLTKLCKTRKKGYRRVTMELQRTGRVMNHKKVLRLMKKYNLLAKLRRKNPYRNILKAHQQHRIVQNILNRKFLQKGDTPFTKIGTDISYVRLGDHWCYLSIMKDMTSGEILSHVLSRNLGMSATLQSIDILEKRYSQQILEYMMIHSDQGLHYTHPSYQIRLQKLGITQSMSRRGNCLDNAPTESFFGHMKDEIDTKHLQSFKELEKYIDEYIFEYNNNRPQWNKKKMTPVEYRNHLLKNKN